MPRSRAPGHATRRVWAAPVPGPAPRPERAISWHRRSRRRRRLGPPRTTRSSLQLRLARRTPCPHCGRVSPTVQGVCADCWGSKGGRQFWIRKTGRSPADPVIDWLSGYALIAALALLPVGILVLVWILG